MNSATSSPGSAGRGRGQSRTQQPVSNPSSRGKTRRQSVNNASTAVAEVPSVAASGGTAAHQENERRQAGQKIWDEMPADNKKILEQIGKTGEEIALILADLHPFTKKIKQGCDEWLEKRVHSRLIVDGLPPQMDEIAFAEAVALTDDSYNPLEISDRCRIRAPLIQPGEGQLAPDSHSSALLMEFAVTPKLREALLRAPETHLPPALKNSYFRPDPELWNDRCAILQRTPALQEVIVSAHALGLGRREAEQRLCDGLRAGFAGMSLAEQLRAVEIMPTQWLDDKRVGRPFAAHYTAPKQLIRVYFERAGDIENLRSLTQASRAIFGGTTIYVNLTPVRARSEFETNEAKSIQKAVQKARAEAQGQQVVRLVEVQLVVTEAASGQQRRGRTTAFEMGRDLTIAFGGEQKGVQAVITATDRHRARPDVRTTIVVRDFAKGSDVPTEFAERIERVLKAPGRGQQDLKGGLFSELRAKQGTKIEICDVKDDMVVEEEEMAQNSVRDCIEEHLWFKSPLYLPMETVAGSEVVFRGDCTPLDDILKTHGRVITEGDLKLVDIRDIFPQPVTTKIFFAALEQMRAMREIEFMHGEQQVGFKFVEIYHPLKHRLRKEGAKSA